MKSDILKNGIETLPHRALLRSTGLKDDDFKKPFIGVADAYNDLIPGHIHLRELSAEVKRGIKDAGGVPFEWGVPGICDGIAMHVEMRLSLPSRDHIADNVELMMLSHSLDGWVGITNCDKITPGMLMVAGRLDLPSIILTGGPMKANRVGEERMDPIRNFGIVGEVKAGKMSEAEAEEFSKCTVCGAGSCCGLYTANTMACVAETLGMSLSHCAATLAISEEKKKQAYETGKRIVALVKQDTKPSQIMTKDAFENAVRVDMALGGSTNTTLHIPAIAKELNIDIPLQMFDDISKKTPNICHFKPSGKYAIEELEEAGGIPAVLKRLKTLIKDGQTVDGKTIFEIADSANVLIEDVIRPIDNPYYKEGGIAVLSGNIGSASVIKQTAVSEDMMVHSGPAKVFSDEDDLLKAIQDKKIEEGDVVVLNFMGTAGAPGMPEMLTPTDAIKGAGFVKVALITDGRFSGGTSGPSIGHIEPEAYVGGNIGLIYDSDIIDINIHKRTLNVRLSDNEIENRKKDIKIPERKMSVMMRKYRENQLS